QGTGGINARPGLVDDYISNIVVLQLLGEAFRDELLGLAAAGAVADSDHRNVVLLDHIRQASAGLFSPLLVLADDKDHSVAQHVAEFVERRHLAAALEARIDRQNAASVGGPLQEQLSQVANEDLDGVLFGPLGHLAADFSLQARHD